MQLTLGIRRFLLLFILLLGFITFSKAQSGIYLRGEVNSWAADANWEFRNEGNGNYSLTDKTLSGAFKIADASWSGNCNYGSGGSVIVLDSNYPLTGGSNPANISCGGYTFHCKRIELHIVSSAEATLTLVSDRDGSALSSVYVIGDNNGWNYADTSGKLELSNVADSTFTGRVTLPSVGGESFAYWNIYQQLGMGGVWGLSADAGNNLTAGRLEKGAKGKVATFPGTYMFSFSSKSGNFLLERIPSQEINLKILPKKVTLVPELPNKVRVLSLNNSLINYARQDTVWNNMVRSMGKDALWVSHSNIGKTLDFQWNETDDLGNNVEGQPSAKTMIRSNAWTHIILQEQTERPRTNFALFRESVKRWVEFIRAYCPNPNAIIILPVNWALRNDFSNYTALNHILEVNYFKVAQEFGLVLAPVGESYEKCYEQEGVDELSTWFRPASENNGTEDDRHPSMKSTYMAACTEYGIIFGENPMTINYVPNGLDASTASMMRNYAKSAIDNLEQVVNHHTQTVRFSGVVYDQFGMAVQSGTPVTWHVNSGGAVNNDGVFTGNGEEGDHLVVASNGTLEGNATVTVANAVNQTAAFPVVELGNDLLTEESFDDADVSDKLPQGWRIDRQLVSPRTLGVYAMADDKVMYMQGDADVKLPGNAKNGTWLFGSDADRAVGGISTGVANATRCVNVYVHLKNNTANNVESPVVGYDVEKYRQGANEAGFDVQLYYSVDGSAWTSAGTKFKTHFAKDAATIGYETIPGETRNVHEVLDVVLPAGGELYLAWNISVATGTTCNAAQALAIDNFSFSALSDGIDKVLAPGVDSGSESRYNLAGQRVDDKYKGIVIRGGRKYLQQ